MEAAEYFSKDFEWEELRAEVENDPSLRCHLLPFESNPSSIKAADEDSAAWKRFHVRHSSGKFFKVPISYFKYRLMSLKLSNRKCPGFVNVIYWVFGCRESSIQDSKKGIDVINFLLFCKQSSKLREIFGVFCCCQFRLDGQRFFMKYFLI